MSCQILGNQLRHKFPFWYACRNFFMSSYFFRYIYFLFQVVCHYYYIWFYSHYYTFLVTKFGSCKVLFLRNLSENSEVKKYLIWISLNIWGGDWVTTDKHSLKQPFLRYMQLAQGKNPICFICFGIGNLSNFAMVKSLEVVLSKNGYFWECLSFTSNLKTNCWLGTINVLLVVTVKMFYMCLFVIIEIFSILDKLKN